MPSEIKFTPEYIKANGWEKFTFTSSGLGYIMTDPRGKSNLQKYEEAKVSLQKAKDDLAKAGPNAVKTREKLAEKIIKLEEETLPALELVKDDVLLSDTCKKYLCDIYTQVMFGRWEDITSKYLEKGMQCEEQAITLYSQVARKYFTKNKVRKSNLWIEGENDFEDDVIVYDTKVNWSIFQFNRVIASAINKGYHWQLDGYMDLFEKKQAKLVYALINTPPHLLAFEERKLRNIMLDYPQEEVDTAIAELHHLHTYDDIAPEDRIRTFTVDRDESRIARIHSRVEDCRKYLNSLTNQPIDIIKLEDDDTEQSEMAA